MTTMNAVHDQASTARRLRRVPAILIAAAVTMLALAPAASAAFDIVEFSGGAFNADGTSHSQAAGHPYSATTKFQLTSKAIFAPDGQMKDVNVDLPAGFVGNPNVTPTKCTTDALFNIVNFSFDCPNSSQVGVATTYRPSGENAAVPNATIPLYSMVPPPGTPADFAFSVFGTPIHLVPELRTGGDYGLTVRSRDTSQIIPVVGIVVTLWGTPADPSHDPERICAGVGIFSGDPVLGCSTDAPRKAFLTNPANCAAGPLATTLRVNSWQQPDEVKTTSFTTDTNGNSTAVTGCSEVPFSPSMTVRPTSHEADSPTGLDVDITMPTDGLENPDGIAQANLKRVQVTLPEGMTVNPSSADGLQGCGDAQLGLANAAPPTCPEASKIGTVSIETPLLEQPLLGGVYVRTQNSNDPASGEMFRLAIVADDADTGIRLKLAGRVVADPATGRLTTTFDDNPQVPFSKLSLHLKSGPRAPLANPSTCGTKTITSELSSWSAVDPDNPTSDEILTKSSSFAIDCPGQGGFAPSFEAGSVTPTGGDFSPFVVRIDRDDREQFLSGVSLDMPKGLIAKLRGVPLCGSFQATNGGCPAGSRVGTATVGAGAGPDPFFLEGPVYLTQGYKGGPYGLSAQVHVKAGPFDLGMVIVRQAIYVDPETAELSIVSDPLPQIVKGVPVRLRSVNVDVDRPGFTINPTSCAEKTIGATLSSAQGAIHKASSRFQVGDCQALAFKPRLAMRLTGRKQRRTGGHPGLRVALTQAGGQANLKGLAVKLPKALALDPDNANGLCSFEEARKADPKCPASSVVGRATAYTPVLNKPLSGPVYFAEHKQVNRFGRLISKLPSLVIALRGEVAINIRQNSDVKGGRLVSTTATIPDAPVSRFDLSLKGGSGGILTVTRDAKRRFDICRGRQTALVESDGQNGRRADFGVRVKTPCKASQSKSGKAKRNRRS